eukprot:TRINITY_DN26833_c0_g1_i2.p1 TRINITY_DN26833_c0_g1~~TRINITY_DN26833_c0_g1_i2.p1  ORF type:complete len:337 (+),score=53.75 TRINITY_DN26833_c0_g1_i2:33-1013(+)
MGEAGKSDVRHATSALQTALQLQQIAQCDIFTGNEDAVGRTSWGRVFGGQVMAQALVAAQRTVASELHAHSLHCYFLLAGESGVELLYEVERVRDGGSFATRVVKALQRSRAIFQLTVSFHRPEWGPSFQTPMRELQSIARSRGFKGSLPSPEEFMERGAPMEKVVGADNHGDIDTVLIARGDWWSLRYFRHRRPLPDDLDMHQSVFAWMSDSTMVGICKLPHQSGTQQSYEFSMSFSLDHSIHFHRPFRADEWLIFHVRTTVSTGSRGLARNEVFSLDGQLVATVTQEALIRVPKEVAAREANTTAVTISPWGGMTGGMRRASKL